MNRWKNEHDVFGGFIESIMRIYNIAYPLDLASDKMKHVSKEMRRACFESDTSQVGYSWIWELYFVMDFLHTEDNLVWNPTSLANLKSISKDLWTLEGQPIVNLQRKCFESLKIIGAANQIKQIYNILINFHVCYEV